MTQIEKLQELLAAAIQRAHDEPAEADTEIELTPAQIEGWKKMFQRDDCVCRKYKMGRWAE